MSNAERIEGEGFWVGIWMDVERIGGDER